MERTKYSHFNALQQSSNCINNGTRVFGQELTNLNDLIKINKEVKLNVIQQNKQFTKQKSNQQIVSSRVNVNYITHAAIMNDLKERERFTQREKYSNENQKQSYRSNERLSKGKIPIRNDQFDSNNVFHHLKIEPSVTSAIFQDKSLVKERPQSLHQQKKIKNSGTGLISTTNQYSVLKNAGRGDMNLRQRSQNQTVHLNLSNLSLTYRLHNPPATLDNSHCAPYNTVRFNDLKTVMDSMDQKLTYNSESLIQSIDSEYCNRPEHVSIYAQESFQYLQQIQKLYMPDPKYFSRQLDVNKKMRSILLDWIVDVQCKFKMRTETLHLTVNILDRYLTKVPIKRTDLQLMGVGAMLIAAKTEEIFAPQIRDLSYITEHAYSKQEIIQAESQILISLDFQLNAPTIYSFINRYQTLAPMQIRHLYLALFVVELFVIQQPQEQLSSNIAAGAFYLVRKIKRYEPAWPQQLFLSSDQDEQQARQIAKMLCITLQNSQTNSPTYFQAVIKKYSSTKFLKVAQLRIGKQTQQLVTTSTMVHDTESNEF